MGGSQYQVKCLLDILIPTNKYEIFFVTKNFDEGYQPKGYQIKKIDASGNAVTIDGNGAETIDGAATQTLGAQYDSMTVFCDGTGWHII